MSREQMIDQAVREAMMESRFYLGDAKGLPLLRELIATRSQDGRPMWWFTQSVRAHWRVLCVLRGKRRIALD